MYLTLLVIYLPIMVWYYGIPGVRQEYALTVGLEPDQNTKAESLMD